MNIEIKIKNKIVSIGLMGKSDEILDRIVLSEERRLSEDLLPSIDDLLKKNNLEPKDVEKMTLESDMGENFTTYRIAKAVVDAFNWANRNNN